MKKIILISLAVFLTHNISAQILYDNGPIDDPNNNFTLEGRSWNHNNLTYFFQNGTDDIVSDAERNAVEQAMTIWENSSEVTFTEVSNSFNADIVIRWATGNHSDGSDFDGTGGVLAHAFFPPPNSGSLAGDMHFDDAETWSTLAQANALQPIDLVTVALHELGHSLGLRHSNVAGAIMNPFYSGSQRFLGTDDLLGIAQLYPKDRSISGTSNICQLNNYLYTINDITQNDIVGWSVSSNLQIVSSNQTSVTVSSSGIGIGWITANINGISVTKNIHIGNPTITNHAIQGGFDNVSVHENSLLSVSTVVGATQYYWSVTPNSTCSAGSGPTINSTGSNTYLSASKSVTINWNECTGTYAVVCYAKNSCGQSYIATKWVDVYDSSNNPCRKSSNSPKGSEIFKIYPNPVKNNGDISVHKEAPTDPCDDGPIEPKLKSPDNKVRIYDLHGNILYENHFKSDNFSISGHSLKSGTYILQMETSDGQSFRKLIVVE